MLQLRSISGHWQDLSAGFRDASIHRLLSPMVDLAADQYRKKHMRFLAAVKLKGDTEWVGLRCASTTMMANCLCPITKRIDRSRGISIGKGIIPLKGSSVHFVEWERPGLAPL